MISVLLFITVVKLAMKNNGICFAQRRLCLGVNTSLIYVTVPAFTNISQAFTGKYSKKIKPVFMELSNDNLLKKCLHGNTKNTNESINGVIWKKCPKEVCESNHTRNEGANRIPDVIKDYGLREGQITNIFCVKKDESRIKESNHKASEQGKTSRKMLRAKRKGFGDREKEREGLVHGYGICDS